MSNRTIESYKAISQAWEKEQSLVREGKCTRDWTPDQQKDILEKGKAYDNDGIAFQGQHMKSAEKYPEYQGNPDNIQFLTRAEHLAAHNGDWRNPTNWYFDPVTKIKTDFGDGPFIPCKVINLSEPVVIIDSSKACDVHEAKNSDITSRSKGIRENSTKSNNQNAYSDNPGVNGKSKIGIFDKVVGYVDAVRKFSNRHPVLTAVVKYAATTAVAIATEQAVTKHHTSSSNYSDRDESNSISQILGDSDSFDEDEIMGEIVERTSPSKHIVRGHGQHYHTKEGIIWREKDSYPRGK